jgi:hypothetical protein
VHEHTHFGAASVIFAMIFCCAFDVGDAFVGDIESDSQNGQTALIVAAASGQADSVRLLIAAGADKDAKGWVRAGCSFACLFSFLHFNLRVVSFLELSSCNSLSQFVFEMLSSYLCEMVERCLWRRIRLAEWMDGADAFR